MSTPDTDGPQDRDRTRGWRRRPRLLIVAMAAASGLLLVIAVIAGLEHQTGHTTAAAAATPRPSDTPTTPTSAPASRASTAVSSSSPIKSLPAPTHPSTRLTHPWATATATAGAGGGGGSVVQQPPGNPGPVGPPSARPTTQQSSPKPPYTPPSPRSTPPPPPRSTPPPPYTPHFVSLGRPAAFAGIPQGGAAQRAVTACVQHGYCGGFGLESGGSCSMPPYRGDTVGAQYSGWAMWEYEDGVCSWAMAVSSF